MRSERQAVHQNMTAAEDRRLVDHFVDGQADSRVVRCYDGAGTDTNHDIDGNLMTQDPAEHSEVRRATQASSAQDDADTGLVGSQTHRELQAALRRH